MEKENKRYVPYLPLLFALLLLTGIFIGTRISPGNKGKNVFGNTRNYDKINDLIHYIEDNYVDTVNDLQLYDAALNGLLQSLDPHSAYIPASDFHDVTDPLKGNFEGIGIQFRVVKDSVVVLNAIPGGPSAKAGLRAGDRIISVNGQKIASVKLSDNDIIKKLKGPKGSKVNLGIFRRGVTNMLTVSVTRDVIPTYSVDAAYLLEPVTGYIKISRFSATTTREVTDAMKTLLSQGIKNLVLDLRDNTGGYLQSSIELANEFLPDHSLIVYTAGRKRKKESYYSDGSGLFKTGKLIVLIDDGSASASEILAGAIQDNDRGTLIGRRSFGKGLVQEELDFKDGSAVRLTVARYYTPTGRCIQKPYDKNHEDYAMEAMKRYTDGEVNSPDSIRFPDSLKYKTPKGKTVYGGGGIMPDVYVPADKIDPKSLFYMLLNNGLLNQFAFDYTDHQRSLLSKYTDYRIFDKEFNVNEILLKEFREYAVKNGTNIDDKDFASSKSEIQSYLKSLIARNIYDDKDFYPIFNKTDKTIKKALEVINNK